MVYHHPDKFDDSKHCDMGDLIILACRVTSCDYVFEGSFDIIG